MTAKQLFIDISVSIASVFLLASPAFAHVIVSPKEVGIAKVQIFDMAVPTEKDTPTIAIKLLIPAGVDEVVPNVKQGWDISVVKKGDMITEIDWVNGSIPPGQRDEFLFQAQVPPTPTTLSWKAYQTYQDGSVVAWDHTPSANSEDDAAPPPYSTTKVINDVTSANTTMTSSPTSAPFPLTLAALALSALSLGIAIKKK